MAEVSDQKWLESPIKIGWEIIDQNCGVAGAVLLTGNTGAVYFIKMDN